ncbi:hypothetical protein Tco_0763874 [Tanacetum coccineum]
MLNRHKNWLVHKQTACGKDFSNLFMVDNLPKIVGFSTHLASLVKSWLVQDQTVLGKDYSNLLIADSLLKTIWFINAPCYGNEALASPKANGMLVKEKLIPLMVRQFTKICMQIRKSTCEDADMNSVNDKQQLAEISQRPRGIFINQSKYALESLKKYGFDSFGPVDTPIVEKSKLDVDKEGKAIDLSHYRGMIGTILYLTASRPDLQFAISMCARYLARPTEKHLHAVKRIFRYLRGTINRGLWYSKDSSIDITAFADADHAGCQDTRRSTSGSMQFLGDKLVSWSSKRQKSVAISSTEAEYIALSKHIDIRFNFIKEQVENGVIELYFVNTEYQLPDIFTKALGRERIEFLINKLGMRSFTPDTLKQLADEVDE